jgi:protein gp37
MSDNSSIEWTDATWNIITGCTLVDEGCRNCYAARLAATRLRHEPSRIGLSRMNAAGEAKFTGEVRFNEKWLDQPLRWTKPRRIFVCAHGDLFHEAVPDEWIDQVFAVMALAPQHTFQVLTKRPDRARAYLTVTAGHYRYVTVRDNGQEYRTPLAHIRVQQALAGLLLKAPAAAINAASDWQDRRFPEGDGFLRSWPLPNVWLGTSISDQASADARIPYLLDTPAAVRFLSAEPLLEQVYLDGYLVSTHDGGDIVDDAGRPVHPPLPERRGLDWVIVGGESGPKARPMHPDWARSLRDQCRAYKVPFFFKQWGEWAPGEIAGPNDRSVAVADFFDEEWHFGRVGKARPDDHADDEPDVFRIGKSRARRILDGRTWDEFPGRDAPEVRRR